MKFCRLKNGIAEQHNLALNKIEKAFYHLICPNDPVREFENINYNDNITGLCMEIKKKAKFIDANENIQVPKLLAILPHYLKIACYQKYDSFDKVNLMELGEFITRLPKSSNNLCPVDKSNANEDDSCNNICAVNQYHANRDNLNKDKHKNVKGYTCYNCGLSNHIKSSCTAKKHRCTKCSGFHLERFCRINSVNGSIFDPSQSCTAEV